MKLNENPSPGGQQVIKNYLELLLISLMRSESEKDDSSAVFLLGGQYDEVISNTVIEYMKEHIEGKLVVDDICKELHYNRSYIYRQFKKTTGSSLMSYFIKMKINRAKELIKTTDMTVSDISDALSFDNPNYFSKVFKKITGYTPSAYKKSKRKK
jgi:YesN/AraC family two-component response regulator